MINAALFRRICAIEPEDPGPMTRSRKSLGKCRECIAAVCGLNQASRLFFVEAAIGLLPLNDTRAADLQQPDVGESRTR